VINIVQAPRASQPYPWAKFSRWAQEQNLSPEQFQIMLENGVEPAVTASVNCTIDEDVSYPGLPSLEGLTLDSDDPGIRIL